MGVSFHLALCQIPMHQECVFLYAHFSENLWNFSGAYKMRCSHSYRQFAEMCQNIPKARAEMAVMTVPYVHSLNVDGTQPHSRQG